MKPVLAILVACAGTGLLYAQFANLVAPGAGTDLYFSSNLPLLPLSPGHLFPGLPPQRWILTARAVDFLPQFETPPIHADWSGLVTNESPAHAGEVVSLYATGLGPVVPDVATGLPGPIDPPARVATPLSCNAAVLYAGLAPGLIGYYQISVELPLAVEPPAFTLSCGNGLRSEIPVVNGSPSPAAAPGAASP